MSRFHAYTRRSHPGLHVWREGTSTRLYLHPDSAVPTNGWFTFDCDFEPAIAEPVRFMLFDFENGRPQRFEDDAHQRRLPRKADGAFADDVWFADGVRRVLQADPLSGGSDSVRIHVITERRLRPSRIFLWDVAGERTLSAVGEDALGPFFDVDLQGAQRSFFTFKFIGHDDAGQFTVFEGDFANRLWAAGDGNEIWTHSYAAEVTSSPPVKRTLRVHFRQEGPVTPGIRMHVWQKNSDSFSDAPGIEDGSGWLTFSASLFTDMSHGVRFWDASARNQWEDPEASREIRIDADTERWTLEGDAHWFSARPERSKAVELKIAVTPPNCALSGALFAHVWVNRARAPIASAVPVTPAGVISFTTYPDVVSSLRLFDAGGRWEAIERHTVRVAGDAPEPLQRFLVVDRPPLLEEAPPAGMFQDPPFAIRRPGAYEEDTQLRFVVHAPNAARARLIGVWTGWLDQPVEMHSTRDGTYWWAQVPRAEVFAAQAGGAPGYHGTQYQFLFDDAWRSQDPAAGWMENSWNQATSRLVQSDRFAWSDQAWRRPGWEYLTIYQLHAARFSNRFQGEPPLKRIAREIDSAAGYLRNLGITAILLLPINEVGTRNSWGYDPAFFYGVENDLGGPDALKELVDTCHRHGLAVILDVVFNHAGSTDNILWSLARDTYFDGDTKWGAMINFDHPQCRHFFAQNLVYLANEFHIDGFRLDHTSTIVHSGAWDPWSGFVTVLGSGGGWDFLHSLRHALHSQVDERCLLMAEHLPNEWSLTNPGGPMDTQWCDDFHDRMVDACRRQSGMSRLAEAMKLSHSSCQSWHEVTNYPESHDEVGNVRDRIAFVAGWGQGLRMSKVAAAGTLLSRGIPMYFMGAESAEDRQFAFGESTPLDLDAYLASEDRGKVRAWWRALAELRRNPGVQGPAPIDIRFADGQILAFTRGGRGDFFVLLNFGGWSGSRSLAHLNLPDGSFRELWNSTWPAFAIPAENEGEHTNGGRDARLNRNDWLNVPDYGAVVLERVD